MNDRAEDTLGCCICTTASARAIESLLEGSGAGRYSVDDPWLVAADLLNQAQQANQRMAIFFASGDPLLFSHWAWLDTIDVVELHRGAFETRCQFSKLMDVNPIWAPVDAFFLKPAEYQLAREAREGIRQHRYALSPAELHPYALCETPPFVVEGG